MASNLPLVTVVIPTYNRADSLRRTLDSLAQQAYPADHYEVLVVDDGSPKALSRPECPSYPFALTIERQSNQGEVLARNRGAALAQGELLVFLDDDITVVPAYLQAVVEAFLADPQSIILGNILPIVSDEQTLFEKLQGDEAAMFLGSGNGIIEVSYIDCMSGILSIGRTAFFELGQMQSLIGDGRNIWGGIDLAYRASQCSYRFYRALAAIAYHHDTSIADLASYCARMVKVSRAVHMLFRKYPDIQGHIPMFHDKAPITWRADPPALVVRKLARQVISSPLALRGMEGLVRVLEARYPSPAILERLYRWVSSAYIYRGYREGLKKLEGRPISATGKGA